LDAFIKSKVRTREKWSLRADATDFHGAGSADSKRPVQEWRSKGWRRANRGGSDEIRSVHAQASTAHRWNALR
jgi:hypothetical protein